MSQSRLADRTDPEASSSSSDATPVAGTGPDQPPSWCGSGEYPLSFKPLLSKVYAYYAAVAGRETEDLPARRRRVALSVIDGYNSWNIDKIMEPCAPQCTHQLLPASLKYPEMGYQVYKDFFSSMMPYFHNLKATIQDVFDDGTENKVVISCMTRADTAIGPYNNEYIFLIYLDKDCNKVIRVLEYVDSAYCLEFFPKLRAYMGENKGKDWVSGSSENKETGGEARV